MMRRKNGYFLLQSVCLAVDLCIVTVLYLFSSVQSMYNSLQQHQLDKDFEMLAIIKIKLSVPCSLRMSPVPQFRLFSFCVFTFNLVCLFGFQSSHGQSLIDPVVSQKQKDSNVNIYTFTHTFIPSFIQSIYILVPLRYTYPETFSPDAQ